MESYYAQQSQSPYFSGYYRQRGSGFGALAAGIGRAALPLARKFLLPAARRLGKELILQAAPELVEVVTKKKTPKQALKSTVKKTVKKQMGGSLGAKRKPVQRQRQRRRVVGKRTRSNSRIISQRKSVPRSRSDFFSKVKNDY